MSGSVWADSGGSTASSPGAPRLHPPAGTVRWPPTGAALCNDDRRVRLVRQATRSVSRGPVRHSFVRCAAERLVVIAKLPRFHAGHRQDSARAAPPASHACSRGLSTATPLSDNAAETLLMTFAQASRSFVIGLHPSRSCGTSSAARAAQHHDACSAAERKAAHAVLPKQL